MGGICVSENCVPSCSLKKINLRDVLACFRKDAKMPYNGAIALSNRKVVHWCQEIMSVWCSVLSNLSSMGIN